MQSLFYLAPLSRDHESFGEKLEVEAGFRYLQYFTSGCRIVEAKKRKSGRSPVRRQPILIKDIPFNARYNHIMYIELVKAV